MRKATSFAPAGLELSIHIYVTSGVATDDSAAQTLDDGDSGISKSSQTPGKDADPEKDAEYDEKASTDVCDTPVVESYLNLKGVTIVSGRPDIPKILEDTVTTSTGPVSVDGAYQHV